MTYDWHLSVPFSLRIIFLKIALPLLWLSHRVIFDVTEVSRRLISTVAVGFPRIGRAQQLFRVVWGEYYEKSPY